MLVESMFKQAMLKCHNIFSYPNIWKFAVQATQIWCRNLCIRFFSRLLFTKISYIGFNIPPISTSVHNVLIMFQEIYTLCFLCVYIVTNSLWKKIMDSPLLLYRPCHIDQRGLFRALWSLIWSGYSFCHCILCLVAESLAPCYVTMIF
jgi:hypothetical protein